MPLAGHGLRPAPLRRRARRPQLNRDPLGGASPFILLFTLRPTVVASTRAQTVLVIHGAGEPRRRAGKVYWESMLGKDLRPDYIVRAPRMPQPTNPQYQAWARRIAELIADGTSRVLVGHSFGASVLLKYLVDAAPRPSFTGLFLIATPFWGPDFPEFALPPDFATRLRDVYPLYLYHSRDDAEVPFEHMEHYRRALPQAIVRALDGRGHEFNQPHFPELAADIRRLQA